MCSERMRDLPTATEESATPLPVKRRLSATVLELLRERDGNLPVWVRSPKRGTEYYTGLSRAKLYELAGEGKIKSASLREPGQVRGCRLFLLSSILTYIDANQI